MAQEEIERLATVAERERIARDLHDLLGHTLSVITLKSELAAKLAPHDPARAAGEMRDVERISRDALSEVRSAVRGYRAQGLEGGARERPRGALLRGRKLLTTTRSPSRSPRRRRAPSRWRLREAVTNVVRHAGAARCAVRLRQEEGGVRLEVCDDGRGGTGPEGAGLSGMRERVGALGGLVTRDGRGRHPSHRLFARRGPRLKETLQARTRGLAAEPALPDA